MTEKSYASRHPGDFPTRAKSNQHVPFEIPQGRVHYSETGVFGLQACEYMANFCSAADLQIFQWKQAYQCFLESRGNRNSMAMMETASDQLTGMLSAVKSLGIKPLEIWLSGRLEQEDI